MRKPHQNVEKELLIEVAAQNPLTHEMSKIDICDLQTLRLTLRNRDKTNAQLLPMPFTLPWLKYVKNAQSL